MKKTLFVLALALGFVSSNLVLSQSQEGKLEGRDLSLLLKEMIGDSIIEKFPYFQESSYYSPGSYHFSSPSANRDLEIIHSSDDYIPNLISVILRSVGNSQEVGPKYYNPDYDYFFYIEEVKDERGGYKDPNVFFYYKFPGNELEYIGGQRGE